MYATAYEQLARNIELFRAGRSFKELEAENVRLPDEYLGQLFSSFAHGMGLGNEWPIMMTAGKGDVVGGDGGGYDGLLETGMVMCIESYIGERGGPDGVKLEQQILVTDLLEEGCRRVLPLELDRRFGFDIRLVNGVVDLRW